MERDRIPGQNNLTKAASNAPHTLHALDFITEIPFTYLSFLVTISVGLPRLVSEILACDTQTDGHCKSLP